MVVSCGTCPRFPCRRGRRRPLAYVGAYARDQTRIWAACRARRCGLGSAPLVGASSTPYRSTRMPARCPDPCRGTYAPEAVRICSLTWGILSGQVSFSPQSYRVLASTSQYLWFPSTLRMVNRVSYSTTTCQPASVCGLYSRCSGSVGSARCQHGSYQRPRVA